MPDYVGGIMGVWALFEEVVAFTNSPIFEESHYRYAQAPRSLMERVRVKT